VKVSCSGFIFTVKMRWGTESKAAEVFSQFFNENMTQRHDFITEENWERTLR